MLGMLYHTLNFGGIYLPNNEVTDNYDENLID